MAAVSVQMYDQAGVGIPRPCMGRGGLGGSRGTKLAFGVSSRQPWGRSSSAGLGGGGDWHMGQVAGRHAV